MSSNLETIDLESKIGQLLMVGFTGTSFDDPNVIEVANQIRTGRVGGIVLFRRNIESPVQLKKLLTNFKEIPTKYPLLIALDQEGGKVQRVSSQNGFKDFLSAKEVAETLSLTEAYSYYQEMASYLKSFGFNFNLAPCVDLDCDPPCSAIGKFNRSFSKECSIVCLYAEQMVKAFSSQSVLCCLKHYPGHGRAQGDTHEGLVDITKTWTEEELQPFIDLCNKKVSKAVMTAHLMHNEIDSVWPTTLSKIWLDKIRNAVNDEIVFLSDDLHMGAIINTYGLKAIVKQVVTAGCDLMLFSNNPLASKSAGIRHDLKADAIQSDNTEILVPDINLAYKIFDIVSNLIKQNELSAESIDLSYKRILSLKELVS